MSVRSSILVPTARPMKAHGPRLGDMAVNTRAPAAVLRSMVLSARITRMLTNVEPPSISQIGAGNTVVRLFHALSDGPALPSALAVQLGVDRSAISRALNRLQAAGLVTRRVDAADRRQVRAALTARGRRLVEGYYDTLAAVVSTVDPQIHEMAAALPEPTGSTVRNGGGGPLGEVIAGLAATGTEMVRSFRDIERTHGMEHWAERFVLWSVCADDRVTEAELSRSLILDPAEVTGALNRLRSLGLVAPDRASESRSGPPLDATDAGREVVVLEAGVFDQHRREFVDLLREMSAAAAGWRSSRGSRS